MCETIDEIQAVQLAMALARARQQRISREERPLESVAQ
jgi:hypothetical protein